MNIKRIFDFFGLNGTRWQWKLMLWEKKLKQTFRAPVQAGGIPLSQVLIGINILFFCIMVILGIVAGLGPLNSFFTPHPKLLLYAGGQRWDIVIQYGEWWRCLTYAFAHGGIIHLVFNMIVLYQVGPLVEFEIGRSRFLFLYVFATLTATGADFLWHQPNILVVGASGAIFGLIGFAAAWYHRLGGFQAHELRNFMLRWAAFSFIFGLIVGADNAAHLGGALGGAAFGFILPTNSWTRRKTDQLFLVLGIASGVAVIAALGMMVLSWMR